MADAGQGPSTEENRASRFGSWDEVAPWLNQGPVRKTFTTLSDKELDERMRLVRGSIETVRKDWLGEYRRRTENVRRVLEAEGVRIDEPTKFGDAVRGLLDEPRDWLDRGEGTRCPATMARYACTRRRSDTMRSSASSTESSEPGNTIGPPPTQVRSSSNS